MTDIQSFSGKRLFHVIRKEFYLRYKGLIISASTIAGLIFLIQLISAGAGPSPRLHYGLFPPVLLITGVIATSMIFMDFHDKSRAYSSIVLPASQLEKFIGKFLLTTAGLILISLIGYFAVSLAAAGLSMLAFGRHIPIFNPFDFFIWKSIGGYLCAHAVFFAGAVYFKRFSLIKTVLTILIVSVGVAVYAGLIAAVAFLSWVPKIILNIENYIGGLNLQGSPVDSIPLRVLFEAIRIIFCYLFPVYLWVLSFFRFKEIEVK